MTNPRIGRDAEARVSARLSSAAEELTQAPQGVELGSIDFNQATQSSVTTSSWQSADGSNIDITEAPPPWEVNPNRRERADDARRFVDVPDNWDLRWINPASLKQSGWRDWQPVMASDPRVKVKVRQMIAVDNLVRRGHEGDILAWMYKSWVESRNKIKAQKARQASSAALDRQQALVEQINRGSFGDSHVDSVRHPTHTQGDGRTMRD